MPTASSSEASTPSKVVRQVAPLGFQWETVDPFLFCVHHDDAYPEGQPNFGPDPRLLAGRNMGNDFELRDGWRMYHGQVVPGFPQHPHRGFETITIVRDGLLDHADSMGAAARYGGGDVQWLTAGAGINHAEMFPLLNQQGPNRVELFQIWLNLPARSKMVDANFTMLWQEDIPRRTFEDASGRATTLTVIAGAFADMVPPSPPPESWGSQPQADFAIWTLKMQPGATWTLPAAQAADTLRVLYHFRGDRLTVGEQAVPSYHQALVDASAAVELTAGNTETEILMLQARPIGEPVARYGPFVMNTEQEIHQAFADYRATEFGGWPWDRPDPVHGAEPVRFARHPGGREERPA